MDKLISDAIHDASAKHGVPIDYMTTMAFIESSFNPKARKGSACGLYQIMPGTARELGMADNDCLDPKKSADAAAKYTNKNVSRLRGLGVSVDLNTNPEYGYLAHQQGASGLAEIIKAAKDGKEVNAHRRKKMDENGGKGMSPSEFLQYWKQLYRSKAISAKSNMKSPIGDFPILTRNIA